jgi:hypothetical protein
VTGTHKHGSVEHLLYAHVYTINPNDNLQPFSAPYFTTFEVYLTYFPIFSILSTIHYSASNVAFY